MSERMALHGTSAPPHTITHAGKTYTIPAAISTRRLLAIEQAIYEREKEALNRDRDAMPEADFWAEMKKLRERYEAGEFALENVSSGGQLQLNADGTFDSRKLRFALFFMGQMLQIEPDDLMELMENKAAELTEIIVSVQNATFGKMKAMKEQQEKGQGQQADPKNQPRRDRTSRRRG